MPPKKLPTVWPASPHTIAKIEILKAYLIAWFQIFGRSRRNQELLYIDGFAGPGEYSNHPEGSPLAALSAAKAALEHTANKWVAGKIHCALIEEDRRRFEHLIRTIASTEKDDRVVIHPYRASFVQGLAELRRDVPGPFRGEQPLFVFIDPFGATGGPFSVVAKLLESACSEVLVNLDADGIARIFLAEESADHEANLADIFGSNDWKRALFRHDPFDVLCRKVLKLYKTNLRQLPKVRYVFSFEMRTSASALNYHLVFASQHPLGLEKMKEAMKRIDQAGDYSFSDASVNQPRLFRFDEPGTQAKDFFIRFRGRKASYADARDFALNHSPFPNPKSMLRVLEQEKRLIVVHSSNPRRRKGSFKESDIMTIEFLDQEYDG